VAGTALERLLAAHGQGTRGQERGVAAAPLGDEGLHLIAAVTADHGDALRLQLCSYIKDMADHRLAQHRVEHLGQAALHALAEAGGEDDDCEG
jgi:hypothetical protein